MIKIPSNIDPYADENIKKLSNSSFCEDIFILVLIHFAKGD